MTDQTMMQSEKVERWIGDAAALYGGSQLRSFHGSKYDRAAVHFTCIV